MTEPTETADGTIRFTEAGVTFEIFGKMPKGEWWMNVTEEDGTLHGVVEKDFEAVCRAVDRWVDRLVPADDPRRFKGFRITEWDHETRIVGDRVYATRGALLEWFDDGTMPDMEELVDLAQFGGDRVLEVRDCAGTLLVDRRAQVKAEMRAWKERELEEEMSFLDARLR